jgi:hypothetical protein
MMPPQGNGAPPPWRTSPAKKLLEQLYRDKLSWIHLCLPQQIYETEPLFKQYPWNNFRNNFNRLMDTLDQEEDCVAYDQIAFEKYRRTPRPLLTKKGEPFWDGHAAQQMLKAFVVTQDERWKNKEIERKMLPAELHATKDEYKVFSLETFRNHYYREMRALLEEVYWQKKRNKEGQRRRDREEELEINP